MDPPLLFIFSPPFYPTYLSPPFYFVDLLVFWRQQVGIDQGDIPDLSQVSVHLTFHFLFSLLYDSHSLFLPPLRPSPLCFWLSFSTTCGFIAPSTLSHPDIYLYLPLHSLLLRHSPPTHFYFKQPSRLTWISSRGNSPSGLIDFLLCLSLLNARYRSNNRAEVCVKLASLNAAPSAISAPAAGLVTWTRKAAQQLRTMNSDLHLQKYRNNKGLINKTGEEISWFSF